MKHGIVEAFAYQETLLVMAVFGIAILAMIWVGFRRWLQSKEKMGGLSGEQTAERAAQHDAQMERVEARLTAIEQIMTDGSVQPATQIPATPTKSPPDLISKDDKV